MIRRFARKFAVTAAVTGLLAVHREELGLSAQRNSVSCCGIIGYIGKEKIAPEVLSQGIHLLQNRGYDSAGMATLVDGEISLLKLASDPVKGVDCIHEIRKQARRLPPSALGVGHTRWATCGERSDANAHPHADSKHRIALVHNGTIFNYKELHAQLTARGFAFQSETDSEVVAVLIGSLLDEGLQLIHAIEHAVALLEGTWGLVVLSAQHPQSIFCVRKGSPLVIGIGHESLFIASESVAFQAYTKKIVRLRENECLEVALNAQFMACINDRVMVCERTELKMAPRAGFDCFYLDEICEQPEAIRRATNYLHRMLPAALDARLGGFDTHTEQALEAQHLVFIASGTSFNAALAGAPLFKRDRLFDSVQTVLASEFTAADLPAGRTIALLLTQSGETADVLKAAKLCKSLGVLCVGLSNVVGSMITTVCDFGVFLNCGREVAVGATKSFSCMVVVLHLVWLWYAARRNPAATLAQRRTMVESVSRLADTAERTLNSLREPVRDLAKRVWRLNSMIVLGKGLTLGVACEGALKLKEIAYLFCEALAAGEIKHGPLALVESQFEATGATQTHIIALAVENEQLEEVKLAISEVKARRAYVIAVSDCPELLDLAKIDCLLEIPRLQSFGALLAVLPLQLLSYEVGRLKGIDVDRPRNLAKAVTVL